MGNMRGIRTASILHGLEGAVSKSKDGSTKDWQGKLATEVDEGGEVDQLVEIFQGDIDSRVGDDEVNGLGVSVPNGVGIVVKVFKGLSEVKWNQVENMLFSKGFIGLLSEVGTGGGPL